MVIKSHYTVSELISKTRKILELSLKNVWVDGEISNLHYHSSGHIYFTLKDSSSEIRCAMFQRANKSLRFELEDGMRIMVYGSVSIFEQRGQMQFIIQKLEVSGIGTLYQAYETLKNKLEDEGLFSLEHKLQLKSLPKSVGIVTSGEGAALRDIIHVLKRRSPYLSIIIRSAKVQGSGAAEDISSGIIELSKKKYIDTIIIGRGGGSIEDLWAFNEEILARTIFHCKIPIISAVGHETDYTIADFVADVRAATPSVAAEIVSLSGDEILQRLESLNKDIFSSMVSIIKSENLKIENISDRLGILQPLNNILFNKKLLKHSYKTITKGIMEKLDTRNSQLIGYEKHLNSLGPNQVLERGYSIAFTKETNTIIRSSKMVLEGDKFYLKTGNGSLEAEKISEIKF